MRLFRLSGRWFSDLWRQSQPSSPGPEAVETLDSKTAQEFANPVCDVCYILNKYDAHFDSRASDGFALAIEELLLWAKRGDGDAQHSLAELLSWDGPYADKESAYCWFYVSCRGNGYQVSYSNESGDPSFYCGPVDDFRNEAEVSHLLDEIGLARIQELDQIAEDWFERYGSSEW